MAKDAKTGSAPLDRSAFLAGIEDARRRDEAARLLDLFAGVTGWKPRLWGASLVGFGCYAYRYASGHTGESFATGFALRKAEISIHFLPGYADFGSILSRLGLHRMGKSCLYIRRLDRVDETVLAELIRAGLADLARRWTVHPL